MKEICTGVYEEFTNTHTHTHIRTDRATIPNAVVTDALTICLSTITQWNRFLLYRKLAATSRCSFLHVKRYDHLLRNFDFTNHPSYYFVLSEVCLQYHNVNKYCMCMQLERRIVLIIVRVGNYFRKKKYTLGPVIKHPYMFSSRCGFVFRVPLRLRLFQVDFIFLFLA